MLGFCCSPQETPSEDITPQTTPRCFIPNTISSIGQHQIHKTNEHFLYFSSSINSIPQMAPKFIKFVDLSIPEYEMGKAKKKRHNTHHHRNPVVQKLTHQKTRKSIFSLNNNNERNTTLRRKITRKSSNRKFTDDTQEKMMKGTLSSMENQFLKQVLKEETSKLVKKKFT